MSIISIQIDNGYPNNPKCSSCGKEPKGPFLYWNFFQNQNLNTDLRLCGDCCIEIEKGLIADLIQLTAITRIRELYPGTTLERTSSREIEEQHKDRELEWQVKSLLAKRQNIISAKFGKKPEDSAS
jgi:hypothetical protein